MGGKDYYEIDQIVGDSCVEKYPDITTMAVQSRQFLVRTVSYLAQQGIRHFIDIGCGLPAMTNTHDIAQTVAPESSVIYVDDDPLVLTHARALLTATTWEGVTTCIDADFHDPELIISDTRNVFDFRQPIAVMFMGVPNDPAVRRLLDRGTVTALVQAREHNEPKPTAECCTWSAAGKARPNRCAWRCDETSAAAVRSRR
ncbi:SAM-dependent methyltransferase [Nocardia sp. NBC_01009]|uniref:SAM-dependent methyltransferase n=1 Tax=Nocardia sp. NBC_01009 TaxID=2975996 RepID=UPI00386FDE01|nr:SAM-dependent methyltransferase [Nocardia sp. NBC_01009]